MTQTYYKKIISLNPNTYKFIAKKTALKKYGEYLKSTASPKSFDNWLKTEI